MLLEPVAATGAVNEETRNVSGVDRLKQQPDPGVLELARGIAEVLDQSGTGCVGGEAFRPDPGKAVDFRTVERRGVVDRPFDARAKLRGPIRMACNAALARRPIAGWQVVEHERESVICEQACQLPFVELVREQELNGVEPRLLSCGETAEEWQLGKHHGEVGCESRHSSSFSPGRSSRRE
jgi:hypothetical protein